MTDIEKNELSDNVIEAVKLLRKDVSQTIYDLQNILDTDNEFTNQLNNNRLLESTDNVRKESTTMPNESADSNGISAQNYMGSIYMRLNNSMIQSGGGKMWENDKSSNSDPIFMGIINKLQNNINIAITNHIDKSDISNVAQKSLINEEVQQHMEQFRKELSWYEQRRIEEYENRIEQTENDNKKLSLQVERLKQRWDSLVESAKERKKTRQ